MTRPSSELESITTRSTGRGLTATARKIVFVTKSLEDAMTTRSPPLTPDQRHLPAAIPISDFAVASRPSVTAAERGKMSWAQIVSAINAALLVKHSMAGLVRRSARIADFWLMATENGNQLAHHNDGKYYADEASHQQHGKFLWRTKRPTHLAHMDQIETPTPCPFPQHIVNL
ncbi:uncharacterized protein N7473_009765 [Penicillium subrubescens]|uniref:Uncharacterized protein n=1 Tax=Penicillium subrubescens TaxID=1316194 RepID=A0A1Q5TCF7_9EURO|nr:uncharacterized protein N7473_009765 [Penicillium subrubescens]KAJ5882879.1 hypothetical protein N7473_009765 [Penicillium subrubescens]OKO97891.1 hypothetical protein PENSUB_9817 [Penicillium subrubescens]